MKSFPSKSKIKKKNDKLNPLKSFLDLFHQHTLTINVKRITGLNKESRNLLLNPKLSLIKMLFINN